MTDTCCSQPGAGSATCELPSATTERPPRVVTACPNCGEKGKPVQGQTVKALLSVTLREVQNGEYLFCSNRDCPVVYFSTAGQPTFTTEHIRELVYQKEPDRDDVSICYCFKHTVGEIRAASPETRASILEDINAGIAADQCACDLRNPQGSCCLGNVRARIKQLESPSGAG